MRRSTVLLVRGVVGVIFAVLAFAWPGLTILVLVGFFAAYAMASGIVLIALGLRLRTHTLARA